MAKTTTKSLTAAAILAAKLPREVVEVPEWGGSVVVQGLSASALADYFRRASQEDQQANNHLMLSLCVVGEDGAPLMGAEQWAQVFAESDARGFNRVLQAVTRLISAATAEALEEAEKN